MPSQTSDRGAAPLVSGQRVRGGRLDPALLLRSLPDAFGKLNPGTLWRNPVMFVVEIGAVWSTVLTLSQPSWFGGLIVFWLWLTVLFANLAEAVAEGRGKAQADTLRKSKADTIARRLRGWAPGVTGVEELVPRRCCSKAISSSSKPASSSPATATSWKALRRWTNRRSRASPRRSSVSPAATVRR
ncbi:potassium-transporting ATPase B chain domain protein [Mycobacterium xenopi 3993]|nr:potassium-transporting ATPase B chain domain protein [Mycobacterium xenopi 3993]